MPELSVDGKYKQVAIHHNLRKFHAR